MCVCVFVPVCMYVCILKEEPVLLQTREINRRQKIKPETESTSQKTSYTNHQRRTSDETHTKLQKHRKYDIYFYTKNKSD